MQGPNFLFLMTDQQRADTLSSDICATPNIDRISNQGVHFSRSYTVNGICSPTRASLFTGLHAHAHGMYDCEHAVDEARARFRSDLPTWSEALAEAGYHCAYFGKWHVERSEELSKFGWCHQLEEDYSVWRESQGYDSAAEMLQKKTLGGRGYRERTVYGVADEPGEMTRTAHIFSRGREYLRDHLSGDEPWCLFLSTPAPHDPYIAPEDFHQEYRDVEIPKPGNFDDDLAGKPNVLKRMQSVFDDLKWDDFAEAIRCYYATCSMIDAQVGKTLDTLQEIGASNNTVVVVLSDHGDCMGAHRLLTKGATPYEEVYSVPLVISAPDLAQGEVCDHIVSTGDLCPTVLELAGLEPFEESHFRSLLPLLEAPNSGDWKDEAYAEFHGQRYAFTQRIFWKDHLKYVMNGYDFDEMYDLSEDPAELHNLADDPGRRDEKDALLRHIWATIHETQDTTMADAHYWSLRFFDLGPDCVDHD